MRNRNEGYLDGFIMRLPNRRITAIKDQGGAGWTLLFDKFHNPEGGISSEDIDYLNRHFESVTPRLGGVLTQKLMHLTEEGVGAMVAGFTQYFHKEPTNSITFTYPKIE